MQRPTSVGLRVRSTQDAHVIFHAVHLKILPMITRRLDTEERREIRPGCVYVWEERGPNTESIGMVGIERWTDSRSWGPSRVRDEFLFYQERERSPVELEMQSDSDTTLTSQTSPPRTRRKDLIKQTYSVLVQTPRGRRKWHLTTYFTQDTLDDLSTIDDIPELRSLHIPPGKYSSARSVNNRNTRPNPYPYPVHPSISGYPDRPEKIPRVFKIQIRPPLCDQGSLAPLAYLENVAPPRRHPMDEKALMSFSCDFTRDIGRAEC
ncbi:hypothetical protein Agabi119p4_1619 [Agaricus bisporus var. burnettii]|uniref:Gti1/Pac2 family-domain-containing protein n=1 Tax=Agaricus bisporus var. burnettii TaxID=192524 RepID=A0A8H7F7Q7_AGABI|nr:hypothetical protein Agabi119p4_1619 [Agaricus bisporus var. burnettii]